MNDDATGKAIGGHARADALSPEERKEIASKAAKARWSNTDIPQAIREGELPLMGMKLPCAVLADGTRVLTQWGFYRAIGRSGSPAKGWGSAFEKVAPFLDLDNIKPFVSEELAISSRPIQFRTVKGPRAWGYKAQLLPEVCEVYLRARDAGKLLNTQQKFAVACDMVMRGLAHVGIVELVDEATGYQYERARTALAEILEKFIAKELAAWVKTFDDDYYAEIYRLRQKAYSNLDRRPPYFGHLTNDVVYSRLAPGVLEELKTLNPRLESGTRRDRHHQWLTRDIGHPKLKEHLLKVTVLMKAASNWNEFKRMLDKALPKYNTTLLLPGVE